MFELLKKELENDFEEQKQKSRDYIMELDARSLDRFSTDYRWKQWQAGEITEKQLREFAWTRRQKELVKEYALRQIKLEDVEKASDLEHVEITVAFSKEHHPTAEVCVTSAGGWKYYKNRQTGYGYDKESTAVGCAMNKSNSIMKELYKYKEARLAEGMSDKDENVCTGRNNRSCIGYGAGYTVLPYFEGGVGVREFWEIFRKMGWEVVENCMARNVNFYSIHKAG